MYPMLEPMLSENDKPSASQKVSVSTTSAGTLYDCKGMAEALAKLA